MVCKTWCCFIWTECCCKNVYYSMDTLVRPNGGQTLCLTMTTHLSSLLSFVLLLLLLLRVITIDRRMLSSSSSSTILLFFPRLPFNITSATSCCMWIGDTSGVRMRHRPPSVVVQHIRSQSVLSAFRLYLHLYFYVGLSCPIVPGALPVRGLEEPTD